MTVTVSGKAVTGELALVDNAVDTTTGTLRLRARFGNREHLLWPGDFVATALTLGEEANALVVPSAAVQSGPKGNWVSMAGDSQMIQLVPIDLPVILALEALPGSFHGDPADRLIVATVRAHALPLATHDAAVGRTRLVKGWKPQAGSGVPVVKLRSHPSARLPFVVPA